MLNLLVTLQRIALKPLQLTKSLFGRGASDINETPRSRAMLLGMPAFIAAVLGVSMVSWGYFGNSDELEARYNLLAEQTAEEKSRVFTQFKTASRITQSQGSSTTAGSAGAENEKEIKKQLDELRKTESTYLNKLISLDPGNPEYRFRLANVEFEQGNVQDGIARLRSIAPDDEPGYARAHLTIAMYYLNSRNVTNSQAAQLRAAALRHVDYCLVRENNNKDAKILKGRLLSSDKRWLEAHDLYSELFEDNPRFFRQLVELNEKLEQPMKSAIVLDQAQIRLIEMIKGSKKDYEKWPDYWVDLLACLSMKKDYATAERLLLEESKAQRAMNEKDPTPETASRVVFIEKRLLVGLYNAWAASIGTQDLTQEQLRQQLDLAKKAFSYSSTNPSTLRVIARISAGEGALADEARAIYDPANHDDAPASVLNEMGGQSLRTERYNDAIRYFELAKRKSPRDPLVLNNLAYSYLVCENKNPDRALNLVTQAISSLAKMPDSQNREDLQSSFYDTRGHALMQMNRLDEAAASFELALQSRPDTVKILEPLIECYRGRDDKQADVYARRLEELKNRSAKEENPGSAEIN